MGSRVRAPARSPKLPDNMDLINPGAVFAAAPLPISNAAKCRSPEQDSAQCIRSSQLALLPIAKLFSQMMIRKNSYDQHQVKRYRTNQKCKKHCAEEFEGVHGLLPTNCLKATRSDALRSRREEGRRRFRRRPTYSPTIMRPLRLTLGNDRGWGLALADEAAAQAQAGNHQNKRECNFLHDSPLFMDIQPSS